MSEDRLIVGRIEQLTVDKTAILQGQQGDKIAELQGAIAAAAAERDSWRRVAERLDREKYDAQRALAKLVDEFRRDAHWWRGPDAPGHCHRVPGVWDDGENAGEPCKLCAAWSSARQYLSDVIGS